MLNACSCSSRAIARNIPSWAPKGCCASAAARTFSNKPTGISHIFGCGCTACGSSNQLAGKLVSERELSVSATPSPTNRGVVCASLQPAPCHNSRPHIPFQPNPTHMPTHPPPPTAHNLLQVYMSPGVVEVQPISFPKLELDSTSSPVVSERQKRKCEHGAILKV